MPTFRLILAYDGTGLVGWQRQASGASVQAWLEDAAAELDGRPVTAMAAGRTDAGVHARGQVVRITLERVMEGPSLVRALNARLPGSIRVLRASETLPTFDPRFDARSKTYRYRIWNGEVITPFERGYAWHVPAPRLDVDTMARAAAAFEGRHDFAAFQAAGSDVRTTERTILSARIWSTDVHVDAEGPETRRDMECGTTSRRSLHEPNSATSTDVHPLAALITLEMTGDGFLRHMVRAIAGTLVEIGRGRRPAEWVRALFASRARAEAGPTAPPEGLFLMRVDYSSPPR
jgi:tRNA pseudouridine38-40 synthase